MGRGCRQPPASERQPSQRERALVREARKDALEAADRARIAREEKQVALNHRNADGKRAAGLAREVKELKPPTLLVPMPSVPRFACAATRPSALRSTTSRRTKTHALWPVHVQGSVLELCHRGGGGVSGV